MYILLTYEETTCSFCAAKLDIGSGILVQACLHPYCRSCITAWINNAESTVIKCPLQCGQYLTEKEIKMIAEPDVLKSLEIKTRIKAVPNAFFCKSVACEGFCEKTPQARVFHCHACGELNCIKCEAIHGSMTCEEYQKEFANLVRAGVEDPVRIQHEIKKLVRQTSGFEQMFANTSASSRFENVLDSMERNPLVKSSSEFDCIICRDTVPAGNGIILQNCFHMFCSSCLISCVENSTDPDCKCPYPDCNRILMPRETRALLPPEVEAKVTKRNWAQAEAIIDSKFHCLTPNCDGFCEVVGDVKYFPCPLCEKKTCIACNVIHEGISCEDYKNRIVQNENEKLSEKALENLLATGRAKRCPRCRTAIEKNGGCDHMYCTSCRTHFNWSNGSFRRR